MSTEDTVEIRLVKANRAIFDHETKEKTSAEEIELLSCPFCGCDYPRASHAKFSDAKWVACPRCGAEGPLHKNGIDWNTRAT